MPHAEDKLVALEYARPPRRRRGVPWLRDAALFTSISTLTGQLMGIALYAAGDLRDLQLLLTWASTFGGGVSLLLALVALAFNPLGLREIAAMVCSIANAVCLGAALL